MSSGRLSGLASHYDLVVVGGGITGAGVLREAVRGGAGVLLVDRGDFASGTSSGSSKLVHGGLRYLQSGGWRLTLESVRERSRLLREAPGLVEPQTFLMPVHHGVPPSRWLIQAGLIVYDLMAGRLRSHWIAPEELIKLESALGRERLIGAMAYEDARTDDARLVQRLIEESRAAGATALNYVVADELLRGGGRVSGVALTDTTTGASREVTADIVINATGVWTRQFAQSTIGAPALRPLRGSHFVLPSARLPIRHAVSWLHPRDRRPVFVYPWEGAVVAGTTDLDHDPRTLSDPHMTSGEAEYLLEALAQRFPRQGLTESDAMCTYSAVRPVVAGGAAAPSAESRESALWSMPGLVSITGGKLTTFRVTARKVLREAARQVPKLAPRGDAPMFSGGAVVGQSEFERRRAGRFGPVLAQRLVEEMPHEEILPVGETVYTWAELRWSARHEQVVHLEDLLLRRTRLGLVSPAGGRAFLSRLRHIAESELGWDAARWASEEKAYLDLWQQRHAPVVD